MSSVTLTSSLPLTPNPHLRGNAAEITPRGPSPGRAQPGAPAETQRAQLPGRRGKGGSVGWWRPRAPGCFGRPPDAAGREACTGIWRGAGCAWSSETRTSVSLGVECCLWAQEPVLSVAPEGGIGGGREGTREHACLRGGARLCPVGGFPCPVASSRTPPAPAAREAGARVCGNRRHSGEDPRTASWRGAGTAWQRPLTRAHTRAHTRAPSLGREGSGAGPAPAAEGRGGGARGTRLSALPAACGARVQERPQRRSQSVRFPRSRPAGTLTGHPVSLRGGR